MIEILEYDSKKIILVGTAHVSKASMEEVEQVIGEYNPDQVAVELCQSRFDSLNSEDKWKNMNIYSVVKDGKAGLLIAHLALSSFQKRVGEKMGVKAGAEMMKAIEVSKSKGIDFELIDREVSVTIKRTWGSLSVIEKMKLFSQLIAGVFGTEEKISEEEIEKMKEQDTLTALIEDLSQNFPKLKKALIDERDQFMAEKIKEMEGNTIVVVLGAGHIPGIKKILNENEEVDVERITQTPKPGVFSKVLKWGIPASIIAVIVYGFRNAGQDVSYEMVQRWVLANGVLASIGALIAGGHIITIISAFIAAPITSLNPMVAAGWVSGLVEAWLRKPKVASLENLSADVISLRGLRNNEVTRVLLVVVLSNIGSSIGTFIGIPLITSLL